MKENQINRRTVVKGAAWAAPAVIAATAMPAFAASAERRVRLRSFLARVERSEAGNYTYHLTFVGGTPKSSYPGFEVAGLVPGDVIEKASFELHLSEIPDHLIMQPDLSSAIRDRAAYWSSMTRVGASTKNGVTYDTLASTYIGPKIPYSAATMSIPMAFVSQGFALDELEPKWGYVKASVTVNGQTYTAESDPTPISWGVGGKTGFRSRGGGGKGIAFQ